MPNISAVNTSRPSEEWHGSKQDTEKQLSNALLITCLSQVWQDSLWETAQKDRSMCEVNRIAAA